MTVVAGVKKDLERFSVSPSEGMAAAALVLAGELDDPGNSATSKSMCARSLLELLSELRELAPPLADRDGLDEIGLKREKRIARRSA